MRIKKGFTLAELLITVAIIAVLVAISIPIFSTHLENAREAVDISTMRSCRSVITAEYISGDIEAGEHREYYYDGDTLTYAIPKHGIGKGTAAKGNTVYSAGNGCELCNYNQSEDHTGAFLTASVDVEGTVHVHWINSTLSVHQAVSIFPSSWLSWTKIDSKGVAGVAYREEALKAMGLSDNHEFTFNATQAQKGTYLVYVYNGKFPDPTATKDNNAIQKLEQFVDGGTQKKIDVQVYEYNPTTQKTEYKEQQEGYAVLRKDGSKAWIQIQLDPAKGI